MRPGCRKKAECVGPSTYDPGMLLEQLPFNLAVDDPAQTVQSPPVDANFGEVFTRRWVVDLILDLCGYTVDKDLAAMRLVDPACGDGAFVLPVLDRLIESARLSGRQLTDLRPAVRGFDLQLQHVQSVRGAIVERLCQESLPVVEAEAIADSWIGHGDFLRTWHQPESVDFVVGNPPYIRPEDVSEKLMAEYRATCRTMSGRADVYVGFFELGLRLLAKNGVLGFICADRWMRNAYGARLRELISARFSMDLVIEMHDVDAFAEKVSAYPAITIIRHAAQGSPVIASATVDFNPLAARELIEWVIAEVDMVSHTLVDGTRIGRVDSWFDGPSSWPTGSPARLKLLKRLERDFAPIETERTRVGIGVATGADAVFVVDQVDAVEQDRLIPLVMTSDITSGEVRWQGRYLVNPWSADGKLVELASFPRLSSYLERHGAELRRRYVSRKNGETWYRTIDPVHAWLIDRPKLLFPDMKMESHPVLDHGGHYPHHNLYYITSDEWDVEVLGGLLLSKVAQFFIESYGVRMRGGTLRFQAQYLRRIRVPDPKAMTEPVAEALRAAFRRRDSEAATVVALELYDIAELPD